MNGWRVCTSCVSAGVRLSTGGHRRCIERRLAVAVPQLRLAETRAVVVCKGSNSKRFAMGSRTRSVTAQGLSATLAMVQPATRCHGGGSPAAAPLRAQCEWAQCDSTELVRR